jgi:uncharacterized membrane protein YdjX (TVP38/TMEM64 family)
MPLKKLALALFIIAIMVLYFVGGGEKYMSVQLYQDLYARSPLITASVFFMVFLIGTGCSLPVTAALAVASGIIFGVGAGFLISLLASTLGGTVALYSSRILLHDLIKRRFSGQFEVVNKGIEKEGAFFLFGLRMIPVIPFGLLNLLVGLTTMRVPAFMLATLTGMVPVILILAYTGSELADIDSFSVAAIFTPGLLLALGLLATFPFLARFVVKLIRRYATRNDLPSK